MAERPIFVSTPDSDELVKEIFFQIHWHSGFARVQKEKNIKELHAAAELGVSLSALKSSVKRLRERHQELVREEVANTVESLAEVDEEIRHLISVVSA